MKMSLLQDYCIDCHGPEKQKSGFRVDRRVHLLKGRFWNVSHDTRKASKSYMIEVIKSDDPEISMPPKGGRLFEDEIEILEQWIQEGADWPGQMDEKVKRAQIIGLFFRQSALMFRIARRILSMRF